MTHDEKLINFEAKVKSIIDESINSLNSKIARHQDDLLRLIMNDDTDPGDAYKVSLFKMKVAQHKSAIDELDYSVSELKSVLIAINNLKVFGYD